MSKKPINDLIFEFRKIYPNHSSGKLAKAILKEAASDPRLTYDYGGRKKIYSYSALRTIVTRVASRGSKYRPGWDQDSVAPTKEEEPTAPTSEVRYIEVVKELTLEQHLERDKKVRSMNAEINAMRAKYKILHEQYEKVSGDYDTLLAIENKPLSYRIEKKKLLVDKLAIQHNSLSDWHCGEQFSKGSTGGLNFYNPDECMRRVDVLSNRTVSYLRARQKMFKLDCVVFHLKGDFMNGWIHDENIETNSMNPLEEIEFVLEQLIAHLTFVMTHSRVKNFIIIGIRGNHGRMTKRFRYSNEKQTSFETQIYSRLKKHFPNVDVLIPENNIAEIELGGEVIRTFHGHEVKYNNGVGGIAPSLSKAIKGWDDTKKAVWNFMGHFHTASMPWKNVCLNGSLVGYNAFSRFYKFAYEPPQQISITQHPQFGFTGFEKILAI